jgi:hypothetical protein
MLEGTLCLESMSLVLGLKVILNLPVRTMCIAYDSTQSHMFKCTFRAGTHGQLGKKPYPILESTYRIGIGLDLSLIPIHAVSNLCTDSSGGIFKYTRYPAKLR